MSPSNIEHEIQYRKILSVTAYIITKLKPIRKVDFIFFFKTLYFAEKKHLARYGNSIIEDRYIAMANGPVPSFTYDLIKGIRGDGIRSNRYVDFYKSFMVSDWFFLDIQKGVEPDYDYLSKSDIECIDESVKEYGNWGSAKLSDFSHDEAWEAAFESHSFDNQMDLVSIAKASGADEDFIKYIKYTTSLSDAEVKLRA